MEPNEHAVETNSMRIVGTLALLVLAGAAGALAWVTLGTANPAGQPATAEKRSVVENQPAVAGKRSSATSDRRPAAKDRAVAGTEAAQQLAQAEGTDAGGRNGNPIAPSDKNQPASSDDLPPDPVPQKEAAPPLTGGVAWLNTAEPLTLESLRGKVVLLDFWTYCCINCMHVLPELKKLEQKYAKQLVVIGVHSAKFETEKESHNIREAILRYEINHPVVNDANQVIWRRYSVRAWPTLWLIDPEGNQVGRISGEDVYEPLDEAIAALVKFHRAKGTLKEEPIEFDLERNRVADTPLFFPGKVLADAASDRLFIADSNHNRIVIATLEGELVDIVGTGESGRADGPFDQATFFRPQGMARSGDVLFVADTENHMIRRVDLQDRTVSTIAGIGEQGQSRSHRPLPAKETALNSPWDLWVHDGKLFIAMAGPHQIWLWDAESDTVRAFAGSGREDIMDGDGMFAALAQPSGLTSDGERLFVADSEVSGIRSVLLKNGEVSTIVGQGLFEFGDEDGEKDAVRLQHPLGVAWGDGTLYVADTYNNKIKMIDPKNRTSLTFLGTAAPGAADDPPQFDEPGGLSVAGSKLYIADTNNHAIRVADLSSRSVRTLKLEGLTAPRPKSPNAPVSDN